MGDAVQGLAGPADSVPGRTPDEWSTFMATQRRRTILTSRADGSHDEPVSQQVLLESVRGSTRTHNPREWLDPDFNTMFVALSRELARHFTPADIRDLFGVDSDYIPKEGRPQRAAQLRTPGDVTRRSETTINETGTGSSRRALWRRLGPQLYAWLRRSARADPTTRPSGAERWHFVGSRATAARRLTYASLTFSARGPFGPCPTEKVTR